MGSFTPNPIIRQVKIKLTSNVENVQQDIIENDEVPQTKKRYNKANIKKSAPN